MKKHLLLFINMMMLLSCGNNQTSSSLSSSQKSSSSQEITVSLQEIMTKYQTIRNYTYTIHDEIFNVDTILRYTEKAYYYQPLASEHSGNPIGYAENETGVFTYVINEDKTVTFGNYSTDSKGNYIHDLWNTKIVSFYDIQLNSLPSIPESTNKNLYKITDNVNKLIISGLAGYGDSVVQEYIDVYIELTSNNTFKTIVSTTRLPGQYSGNVYGEFSEVGSTEIPEIQEVLDNNGGPEVLDNVLIDVLKKYQMAKNYSVKVSGALNYEDRFTIRNYYSKNLDNDTLSKGYAGSEDGVFKYTLENGEVKAGELISNGSGGYFDSIWNGLPNFYNFSLLNLSTLNYSKEGNKYIIKDISTIYTFALVSHVDANIAYNENNTLILEIDGDIINYKLNVQTLGEINGKIYDVFNTKITEIETYIANGGGPLVYEDIDSNAKELLVSLTKARNYTLKIKSTYVSGNYKPFENVQKFTNTVYFKESSEDNIGYIQKDEGVFSFSKVNDSLVLGEKVKEEGSFLWASDLFKGLNTLSTSELNSKKIADLTYSITDNTNKNAIYVLAGFNQYDLMFSAKSVTFKINDVDTKSITFTIDVGDKGIITIDVVDVGMTSITGSETL